MTDADAFLAAIVAAPGEDLPRLVYADWLDEHGDPDRAEFIRLQIAVARGELAGARALAAGARALELQAANKARWEIPDLHGGQTFRRGFVEGLRISTEEFVTHADRIGRAAPVTGLQLVNVGPHLDALVRVPWLSRLEELDLANNWVGHWLDDLLAAVPFPNLRALELRNNVLFADAVRRIAARAPALPRLTRLNLSGNPVSDEGAEALAETPNLHGLTDLILRSDMQPFTDCVHAAGAGALARGRSLTRLRYLDLAGHYIGDAGLVELARSPVARTVEHLDVSDNDIGELGDSGVEAVVESAEFARLGVLNLGRNTLGRLGAEALARWPRLARLDAVDLTGCDLSEGVREILLRSRYADRFRLDEPTYTV